MPNYPDCPGTEAVQQVSLTPDARYITSLANSYTPAFLPTPNNSYIYTVQYGWQKQ